MTDDFPTPPSPGATDDGEPTVASAAPAADAAPAAPAEPVPGVKASDAAPFRAPFPEVLPAPAPRPPDPVAVAPLERPSAPEPPPIAEPAAVSPEAREGGPPPPSPPRREARDEGPPPAPREPASGRGRREGARPPRGPRPDLVLSSEPLYRDSAGYRMRLEPPDLARLRELPGSKGKTDLELGETFFDGQAARFAASLAEDVPAPADVRVVVDPYSRQAFLAVEKKIRSILSF